MQIEKGAGFPVTCNAAFGNSYTNIEIEPVISVRTSPVILTLNIGFYYLNQSRNN